MAFNVLAIPKIPIKRLRLYARTCKRISVLTCPSVLVTCAEPIQCFSVPKTCSIASSHFHRVGLAIQASVHGIQYRLVLPAADPPLVAGCALFLDRTMWADVRPVCVDPHAVLDARLVSTQPLSGRTLVFIVSGDVDEVSFAEAALKLRGICFGNDRFQRYSCHCQTPARGDGISKAAVRRDLVPAGVERQSNDRS